MLSPFTQTLCVLGISCGHGRDDAMQRASGECNPQGSSTCYGRQCLLTCSTLSTSAPDSSMVVMTAALATQYADSSYPTQRKGPEEVLPEILVVPGPLASLLHSIRAEHRSPRSTKLQAETCVAKGDNQQGVAYTEACVWHCCEPC
jgi:hypothetical protein